jgi:hypothetical protein
MEMSNNTKNKIKELNTILTKILDEGDVEQRGCGGLKVRYSNSTPSCHHQVS